MPSLTAITADKIAETITTVRVCVARENMVTSEDNNWGSCSFIL